MDNKLEDFLGDVISTEEKMKDLIKFIYIIFNKIKNI